MIARTALLLLSLAASVAHAAPEVADGDLIFQTSRSSQSVAIQRATGSRLSHMGLVLFRQGKPYVLEASSNVRYTPLERWIAAGEGGHYTVKRLKNAATKLTPTSISRMREVAGTFEGRPYDLTFEWSDDRIYCSELVWKIYDRAMRIQIGQLQRLKEFNLKDPAVKAKMHERYGDNVPLEELVISPAAMFNSDLLVTVRNE